MPTSTPAYTPVLKMLHSLSTKIGPQETMEVVYALNEGLMEYLADDQLLVTPKGKVEAEGMLKQGIYPAWLSAADNETDVPCPDYPETPMAELDES